MAFDSQLNMVFKFEHDLTSYRHLVGLSALFASLVQQIIDNYVSVTRGRWDEDTATLRTAPSSSNRIIGLFRFFAPAIVAAVDFAVGLRRKPGGAWAVWHLQRPSNGEPLYQTVTSVNGYLASVNRNVQPQLKSQDWLEHPWKEGGENEQIQIWVEEIKVHGRIHHFVKASSAIELPDITQPPFKKHPDSENQPITRTKWPYTFGFNPAHKKQSQHEPQKIRVKNERSKNNSLITYIKHPIIAPESTVFHTLAQLPQLKTAPPVAPPSEVEIMQVVAPLSLENLSEDITITNFLDYYLDPRHLTAVNKQHPKTRTTQDHPPARDLEHFEIQGGGEMETWLLRACKNGRSQEVSELICHDFSCVTQLSDQPHSANSIKFDGFQYIHWAVIGGHIDVIRTLLHNGADFYSRKPQGWSSVHLAALFGRFVTMKWLIEYALEKQISSYDDESLLDDRSNPLLESPLHLAQLYWRNAITSVNRQWINYVPNKWIYFEEASSYERQFQYPGKYLDEHGQTVLWHTACAGPAPEVEYLVDNYAAALSMGDKNGMSPLHAACHLGHSKVVKVLLQAGANPNITTTTAPGLTPAHFAAICDHPYCLQELITYGEDVHKSTESEEVLFQPTHLAAANKYGKSLSILRDAGGDPYLLGMHYILRTSSFREGKLHYQYKLLEYGGEYPSVEFRGETPPPTVMPVATTNHVSALRVPEVSPSIGM
ncbi:ankyrin repeat-containing domain protein [Xylaria venustula]|nr:ankyrin repeat-containing domain protein [Xylaria venustula]